MSHTYGINPSVYEPGQDVTGQASADVTARRLVKISGNRSAGGNLSVAPCAAGDRAFGVAGHDAATGALVRVVRGAGRVVKITSSGAIAANAEVQAAADGKVTTLAAGRAIGFAVTGAADAADAEIALYA